MFHPDIYGPRKIHVVFVKAIRDDREQKNIAFGFSSRRLVNFPDQEIVDIEGR